MYLGVLYQRVLKPAEPQVLSSQHGTVENNCPNLSFLNQTTQLLLAEHSRHRRRRVCLHFQLDFCHLVANTLWSSMCLGSFSPLPFDW